MPTIELSRPQLEFLSLQDRFAAFVGGYGSGKSFVGACFLISAHHQFPKTKTGYFGPSYRNIKDVFHPTIEQVSDLHGYTTRVRVSDNEIDLYRGKIYTGTIICRSFDRPDSIVGFEISHALVDELDTLPPAKAKLAWRRVIARLRLKPSGAPRSFENRLAVTTTPEGFGFVYDRWERQQSPSYGLVQASTYDNARHLPEGYIDSLLESYDSQAVDAYLHGRFVNLTSGSVYRSFDRHANAADPLIKALPRETLHIGMDFNIGQMAAVIHIIRQESPIAVGEIVNALDTPAMIEAIRERYGGVPIIVYPDASGASRSTTGASISDIRLLQQAGFKVQARRANPPVKDRVNSMNRMFCDATGRKLYKVHTRNCPRYVECLEQQAYDQNGQPDKQGGFDHLNDAAGYFINYTFGIARPSAVNIDL